MKELMLEQETIEDLIKQLRDTRFSNEKARKDFIYIIAKLASAPDKTARKVIKTIGDFMSDAGDEILNNTSSLDPEGAGSVDEIEGGIINMDQEEEKEDTNPYKDAKYVRRFL